MLNRELSFEARMRGIQVEEGFWHQKAKGYMDGQEKRNRRSEMNHRKQDFTAEGTED